LIEFEKRGEQQDERRWLTQVGGKVIQSAASLNVKNGILLMVSNIKSDRSDPTNGWSELVGVDRSWSDPTNGWSELVGFDIRSIGLNFRPIGSVPGA